MPTRPENRPAPPDIDLNSAPAVPIDGNVADIDLDHLSEEQRMVLAIAAIQTSNIAQRKAARDYRVPRGTLKNRLKGIRPRAEAHAHERKLTAAQEEVLTEWVKVRQLFLSTLHF